MERLFFAAVCLSACLTFNACGDKCGGLCGSQCELIDCSYDLIYCQKYASPNDAIVIHYKKILEEVEHWTAKIVIDVVGMGSITGTLIEGNEFLNRVLLTRPGGSMEQFPKYTGTDCIITEGGLAGQKTSGECNFFFINGYALTAKFSCTLEAIE